MAKKGEIWLTFHLPGLLRVCLCLDGNGVKAKKHNICGMDVNERIKTTYFAVQCERTN